MDSDIKSLLDQEPFKPLINLFSGHLRSFSSKLLLSASRETVFRLANVNDKQLRALFEVFLDELERKAENSQFGLKVSVSPKGYINLTGIIRTSALQPPRGRFTTEDLVKSIPDILSQEAKILFVDLSADTLVDSDMLHIKNFVEKLENRLVTVDLSFNRFHGYKNSDKLDKPLLEMLRIPIVKFVDMSGNPFASLDRTEFFHRLYENAPDLFSKLIFIPSEWMLGSAWQCLLPKKEQKIIDTIVNTHQMFYKEKREVIVT